jgi:hypothetical protein
MSYINCESCNLPKCYSYAGISDKVCYQCKQVASARESAKTSKKQVFRTEEIPHLWAHRIQSSARNAANNLFYTDSTIYSYRTNFPIATHVVGKIKGSSAVLVTNVRYSVTTSKHIHMVQMAIPPSVKTFHVINVQVRQQCKTNKAGEWLKDKTGNYLHDTVIQHDKNLEDYRARIEADTHKAAKARTEGSRYRTNAESTLAEMRDYAEFFGIKGVSFPVIPADLLELKRSLQALDKKRAEDKRLQEIADAKANAARKMTLAKEWMQANPEYASRWDGTIENANVLYREQREAERKADADRCGIERNENLTTWMREHSDVAAIWDGTYDQGWRLRNAWYVANRERLDAEKLATWMQGANVSLPYTVETALRIIGDTVETSRGASFPLTHARLGWALVKRTVANGIEWKRNGHTLHLGHFQIDRITSDGTVYAGCHKVKFAAIQRIASALEVA